MPILLGGGKCWARLPMRFSMMSTMIINVPKKAYCVQEQKLLFLLA
jgi:hypothetical protein